MNFKALAASTLIALSAFGGGAAQAAHPAQTFLANHNEISGRLNAVKDDNKAYCEILKEVGQNLQNNDWIPTGDANAFTRKAYRQISSFYETGAGKCRRRGDWETPQVAQSDAASDAEMDALFGVLFGDASQTSQAMTHAEATNWCRSTRGGSHVRVESGPYGQTGKWECVSFAGHTAGVVQMK